MPPETKDKMLKVYDPELKSVDRAQVANIHKKMLFVQIASWAIPPRVSIQQVRLGVIKHRYNAVQHLYIARIDLIRTVCTGTSNERYEKFSIYLEFSPKYDCWHQVSVFKRDFVTIDKYQTA